MPVPSCILSSSVTWRNQMELIGFGCSGYTLLYITKCVTVLENMCQLLLLTCHAVTTSSFIFWRQFELGSISTVQCIVVLTSDDSAPLRHCLAASFPFHLKKHKLFVLGSGSIKPRPTICPSSHSLF